MLRTILFLSLIPQLAFAALDLGGLAATPVQEQGRKKPFLVFADEAVTGLTGRAWVEKDGRRLVALEVAAALWLAPAGWDAVPVILINDKALQEKAGLDRTRKRYTYAELVASTGLRDLLQQASELRAKNPKAKLDPLLKSAADAGMRLAVFEGLVSGRSVTLLPTGAAAWTPLAADDPALAKLREGFRTAEQGAFDEGLRLLHKEQSAENPRFQADPGKMAVEVFYQRLHPFRWAWVLYLAAGIVLAVSAGRTPGYLAAWALALGGFALQVAGFVLRILVSGRAPVTNMYESVVWVAFGTILFALVFEAIHRSRYFLLGAVPVAVVSLILADTQPMILNRSIQPLVPVLADNFWLTTHVLTITLSYAAFALALGVAHIALGKIILGAKPAKAIYNYLYRALQVGVLLLAIGTILGGVWANYSWGRFWDWDPKETWALIALLGYLFLLHGRIAGKWGDFGMAVGAVLAFQSIIMAWYGVNFVLGVGLHSYGFGTGGFPVAAAFVLAELAFIALAFARRKTAERTR